MSKKRGRTLTLGVIIGFFIGLFLAPKKGKELRRDAKEKIDTIKENPKDVLHETFDGIKEKLISIKDEIVENNNIEISEEDILISKSFEEGDK